MELLLIIALLWFGMPFVSYAFYWYEVSTPSCTHEGAKTEREILQKLLHRDLRLVALSGLISSILALPLIVLFYPFGLVSRWWNVRTSPSAGTVIFLHGLFHNPSGAILLKRAFVKRGFSFISLYHRPWEKSIFDLLQKLENEIEKNLAGISKDEPLLIIGHSLGGILAGLLGRRLKERGWKVRGVISLGAPFYGSRLAVFARCSMARRLYFGSHELHEVRKQLSDPPFPAVQFWSPADNMVIPLFSLYEVPKGWDRILTDPLCHTGIIFWPGLIKKVTETVEKF